MTSPVSSPVTVAFFPASVSSAAFACSLVVLSSNTFSPATSASFDPFFTHSRVQLVASPAIMCFAPHMASLTGHLGGLRLGRHPDDRRHFKQS